MSIYDFHVGDVGADIVIEWKKYDGEARDLTGATLTVIVRPPTGASNTLSASLVGLGTDGVLLAPSVAGTFPVVGDYVMQGRAVGTGLDIRTREIVFSVGPAL